MVALNRCASAFGKVPRSYQFIDLSDYARPLADLLVRWLLPTSLSPKWVTGLYTLLGVISAVCYWIAGAETGRWLWLISAGTLLQLKNLLDGVDGALARARHTPSRVGRFLDSLADFFIHALVFIAIAPGHLPFALLSLFSATLQGSYYNYYYVVYRRQTGGDTTSRVDETEDFSLTGDNLNLLSFLKWLYAVIYGWQDRLMHYLERATVLGISSPAKVSPFFLSLTSPLALGFQILLLTLFTFVGHPQYALWIFLIPMSAWSIGLIVLRRFTVYREVQLKGVDTLQEPS